MSEQGWCSQVARRPHNGESSGGGGRRHRWDHGRWRRWRDGSTPGSLTHRHATPNSRRHDRATVTHGTCPQLAVSRSHCAHRYMA